MTEQTRNGSHPIVRLMGLYSEAALHPGTGSNTGAIDLPIQRERHTGFPLIPASSLKGSLRERAELTWSARDPRVTVLFGPEVNATGGGNAGAIGFGETQLVAFPVRSTSQIFVWVTCPLVLDRLGRNLARVGRQGFPAVTDRPRNNDEALAPQPQGKSKGNGLAGTLVLEDLSFTKQDKQSVHEIAAWMATNLLPSSHVEMRTKLEKHLLLVSDENFEHLVRVATQISARIKLNDKKTTTGGGGNLWYEETLPRDCLFMTAMRLEAPRPPVGNINNPRDVEAEFTKLFASEPYIQLGGNETVGQGWCAVQLL